MYKLIKEASRRLGFDVQRLHAGYPRDFSDQDIGLIKAVQPYTMTSPERVVALLRAVEYICVARIPGAFMECGVWKGGSMMAVAMKLIELGEPDRELYLFDTFEGMTDPGEEDISYKGNSATEMANSNEEGEWGRAEIEEVKRNMESTGYSPDRFYCMKGKVEDSIPLHAPETISLLRLDTDWYESTKHELVHLFPRLEQGGVLIVDDYGHWQGARKAVDEYLAETGISLLLNRIDYTGRIAVKT